MSLGDERTVGAGDATGFDTVIDDIEVVELEARYKIEGGRLSAELARHGRQAS